MTYRPPAQGRCIITDTPLSTLYSFADEEYYRTVFLEKNISEGCYRWSVKIGYANKGEYSEICMGTTPSDSVSALTALPLRQNGACSLLCCCRRDGSTQSLLQGVSNAGGVSAEETNVPVPTGSNVAMEVDISSRSLAFFVNGVKVPLTIGGVHAPLHLGICGWRNVRFHSLSFHRLATPTFSPVRCRVFCCRPMMQADVPE